MTIRRLETNLINQIAAGEVIERPSSVIKEVLDNAIDAGADEILIEVCEGGKTLIRIKDNGSGMSHDDLSLCAERHTTSKLPDNNLFNIQTFGFRGEALASIGSISRLYITTKTKEMDHAWKLGIHGGEISEIVPASHAIGTSVEILDLFYAIPARLKFLKSTNIEFSLIKDVVDKCALSHPFISFKLNHNDKKVIAYKKTASFDERLNDVLGREFSENTLPLSFQGEDFNIKGVIGLPTYNFAQNTKQFFYLNNRPLKDKFLSMILKIAYGDLIPKERNPVCCLFLDLPPAFFDINVHPAKHEVRFRDPQSLKEKLIPLIRSSLNDDITRTSTHLSLEVVKSFEKEPDHKQIHVPLSLNEERKTYHQLSAFQKKSIAPVFAFKEPETRINTQSDPLSILAPELLDIPPLGYAKAQMFNTYIISQNQDAFFIVDQHAAAERLLYEDLKKRANNHLSEMLLIPEIIPLSLKEKALLDTHIETFNDLGIKIEFFGIDHVKISAVPTHLKGLDIKQFFADCLSFLESLDDVSIIKEKILEKLATQACHQSIRSGRSLSLEEMNQLLRQIETTPKAAQCNHGRPSFVKLTKTDLEILFERR